MSEHALFPCYIFFLQFLYPNVLPKAQHCDPLTHLQSPDRRTICSSHLPCHVPFCFGLSRHCIFASFLVAWLGHNLPIISPDSQHRKFGFPHTITFSPFRTCFSLSTFHWFAFFPSQYAPTGSAECPTSTIFSRLAGAHLLFAQPASPHGHSVCFGFHTLLHFFASLFLSKFAHIW